MFPEADGEDFALLKQRMHNFKETIFVDDYVDIKNLINEMRSIDPERIQEELVPKLE